MKSALKSSENTLRSGKTLENTFFSVGFYTADGDLSQYRIVLPLFGATYNAVS